MIEADASILLVKGMPILAFGFAGIEHAVTKTTFGIFQPRYWF